MTSETTDIEIYLSEIAEKLWSGHASLMVGAGFSMNAKKNAIATKEFPSWNDLGDCFYQKLFGKIPTEKDKSYLDVLKLANEVEVTFGRPALNKILRDEIPNMEYQPSELHEKLLQLPWTDIFTTNYDTLLERTAGKILEQRYETVVNKEDLVWSTKPRIIKLHGSFPSERPFIITEEDYRKYPKEYAPFVNTVQQSLLENTLCLIGFSGSDPNFQKWIGWINDNLGKGNSPKMFLIGKLSLPIGQKKLLENRNIIPIDLSCYSDDHYYALIKFVEVLKKKGCSTENNLNYPNEKSYFHYDQTKEIAPQFEAITEAWKTTRHSYPNWVILPQKNRELFRHYTENHFIYNIGKIDTPLDIEFLYEFNWRIEKCLYPIFNDWISYYENVIAKYNPFPHIIEMENAINTPKTDKNIDWNNIAIYWIELQLSLLRYYREESFNEKWLVLAEKIDKIKSQFSPDLLARYGYERCLFYLFLLDIDSVRIELTKWKSDTSLPYWEAKRAGLIAELGDIEQAESILETSLNEVRNRLQLSPVTNDYALVSQEAYILQLLRYVKNSIRFSKGVHGENETEKYSERWNELIKYRCDPWGELKSFEFTLKTAPQDRKNIEKKYNFGIGSTTSTYHLDKGSTYAMESYAFLRYIEEIGIPFRLSNVTFGLETAKKAIACVSNYSPNWAFVSLVRTGDSKIIDDIFNRRFLAFLNQQQCDEYANNYLDVLTKSAPEIAEGNTFNNATFAISLSMTIPVILSRLCVKCSYDVKIRMIDFLKELYLSDNANRYKYAGIDKLVEYLTKSFSLQEQYDLIPKLLEFPIVNDIDRVGSYPDIFAFIRLDKIKTLAKIKIDTKKVDELILFLQNDNPNRKNAISRLILLWECRLLNKSQESKFAKALWGSVDKNDFPSNTNYYYFAFLKFPHPNNVNPSELLRNYVNNTKLPIENKKEKREGISMSREYPIFINILGTANNEINYQWNKVDINNLVSNIIEWWNLDKEYLKQTDDRIFGSLSNEFKDRFKNMIRIFSNVIISNIGLLDSALFPQIDNLLNELSLYGIPDLEAKVSFLNIFPNKKQEIYDQIKWQLYSKNKESILDTVNAISVLAIFRNENIIGLVKNIAENIKSRTDIALDRFLSSMAVILKHDKNLITDSILNDLHIGFDFLYNEISIDQYDTTKIVSKKLLIQRSASYLLIVLKRYYSERNNSIPSFIIKWEEMCLDVNEFAEIRNIWLNKNFDWVD